jgi:hypothetical protein
MVHFGSLGDGLDLGEFGGVELTVELEQVGDRGVKSLVCGRLPEFEGFVERSHVN